MSGTSWRAIRNRIEDSTPGISHAELIRRTDEEWARVSPGSRPHRSLRPVVIVAIVFVLIVVAAVCVL